MSCKHPIKEAIRVLNKIAQSYNFIETYVPIVDLKKNCFNHLLMDNHICLSINDTFLIKRGSQTYVLRPHCSNIQIVVFTQNTTLIKSFLHNGQEICFYTIGQVFRKDKSSRHSYFFHQFDGVMCSNNHMVFDYIEILLNIIFQYLEYTPQYLIRESYFPFTYPSYEIDIMYENNWIEILGCGLTHSKILENFKLNKLVDKIFAFGVGVERLVMIKHKINNIHKLRVS